MLLEVDRESDEPVYAQVARQVREHVASGALRPGAALPSVRTLAGDLGVNLNTIARAYRQLEDEGFVVIRDREGVEVAKPAAKADRGRVEALRAQLREVLGRLRQAGLDTRQIERAAIEEIGRLRPEGDAS